MIRKVELEANPWTVLTTTLVHQNPWFSVRDHEVIRPDGEKGKYTVVDTRIATGAVALTEDQQIYLVGQFRFPVDEYSWEIIEGGTEEGEEPLAAAQRELREEAGLVAKSWTQLGGELHLSNCISSERGFIYLAQGLEEVGAQPDGTEILQLKRIPLTEAIKLVDEGIIKDTISVIAIMRIARLFKL